MARTVPVGSFPTAVQGPRWSREGKPTGSEGRQELSVLGGKVLACAGHSTGGGGACRERGLEPHKGIHLILCLNTSLHRHRANPYKARQEQRLREKTDNRELQPLPIVHTGWGIVGSRTGHCGETSLHVWSVH